jgi:hypothetical protein
MHSKDDLLIMARLVNDKSLREIQLVDSWPCLHTIKKNLKNVFGFQKVGLKYTRVSSLKLILTPEHS